MVDCKAAPKEMAAGHSVCSWLVRILHWNLLLWRIFLSCWSSENVSFCNNDHRLFVRFNTWSEVGVVPYHSAFFPWFVHWRAWFFLGAFLSALGRFWHNRCSRAFTKRQQCIELRKCLRNPTNCRQLSIFGCSIPCWRISSIDGIPIHHEIFRCFELFVWTNFTLRHSKIQPKGKLHESMHHSLAFNYFCILSRF